MKRIAVGITVGGALLAGASAAGAADYGNWRVTATGTLTHKWTLGSERPCGYSGSGRVSATMRGESRRFRLRYASSGGYSQWEMGSRRFRARGDIRRTDGARQNPPRRESEPCKPRPRNGCGVTRKLHRRAFGSIEGQVPSRNPRITFSFYNLLEAFPERSRCYVAGFYDFNSFPGAPYANYGRLVGRMPSPGKLRRRAFTVTIRHRRAKVRGERRTTTIRRVTLRFRPV